MLELLSDEVLVDAYFKAVQLKLDPDFIRLLDAEMKRRKLKPKERQPVGA